VSEGPRESVSQSEREIERERERIACTCARERDRTREREGERRRVAKVRRCTRDTHMRCVVVVWGEGARLTARDVLAFASSKRGGLI
jgi:hypothetical protein